MKLGVITDGISRDFAYALAVMEGAGLRHAELQFLWGAEVGDLDAGERRLAAELIDAHGVEIPCVSRHVFGGLSVMDTVESDAAYTEHLDGLKRCIELAQSVACPRVRIMSFRKEMILFGSHGADVWNVSAGAWAKLVGLIEPAVRVAEDAGVTLVVETGNNAMVTSAHLAGKLIDDIGSPNLRALWDPCNSLYCNEPSFPDGYDALHGGKLGHVHIKDGRVDIPRASVSCTALGDGDMAPHLAPIADALRSDGYAGVVSLESVYRPDGGTFEDGFLASLDTFRRLFGA
ncbi:sugar phosphate isomerase/epimerase [Candidatus Poribacteria bacterium]|jgi:sugar phosphate isomerase/epimerase|nr:sugar phosphate isomerase/epimerase [Candidatus Poribacteria bacterium]MBT5535819.1 sugar phosphate isomerase/epimerase [Candidatus Poribacteria bacterium]MBT5711832.1 sugar phosphate isomerase/epimerase [Candidatus Poribacteria bacterium]MBT7100181.1 sugar phosphate isomerase/epimerase [Candidatus Poribacteria bacterium]MBT7808018.1 sugar phosphate isomerase/epimerase [Candidatus Poribacteria bacterium]